MLARGHNPTAGHPRAELPDSPFSGTLDALGVSTTRSRGVLMTPAHDTSRGPHAACVCCGKTVARLHGLVILLRNGKRGVSFRLTTVGYCAEHREESIDAALEPFRGHGQIVTVSSPDLVRPNKQLTWRRATVARLSAAAQELIESAVLVDAPPAYPDEPVPAVDTTAGPPADDEDDMTPKWLAPDVDRLFRRDAASTVHARRG
jgi:hypothetical protein